jgi:hypothetical protein
MSIAAVVLRTDDAIVVSDAGALTEPDLATVDALARLALAARRAGRSVRVRHPSAALSNLLELAGLGEIVRCEA